MSIDAGGIIEVVLAGVLAILQTVILKKQNNAAKHQQDEEERNKIILMGIDACLNGLHQKGCNGPVTAAMGELEEYKNKKAAQ